MCLSAIGSVVHNTTSSRGCYSLNALSAGASSTTPTSLRCYESIWRVKQTMGDNSSFSQASNSGFVSLSIVLTWLILKLQSRNCWRIFRQFPVYKRRTVERRKGPWGKITRYLCSWKMFPRPLIHVSGRKQLPCTTRVSRFASSARSKHLSKQSSIQNHIVVL